MRVNDFQNWCGRSALKQCVSISQFNKCIDTDVASQTFSTNKCTGSLTVGLRIIYFQKTMKKIYGQRRIAQLSEKRLGREITFKVHRWSEREMLMKNKFTFQKTDTSQEEAKLKRDHRTEYIITVATKIKLQYRL